MTKVNWRLLGKSVWACAVGAFTGTAVAVYPFSVTVQMGASNFQERLIFAMRSALQLMPWLSLITFVMMVVLGLPIQKLIQDVSETRWWPHAISAMAAGLIIPACTGIGILYSPFGGLAGFLAGSMFWLIRRPDKDERQQQVQTGAN